MSDYIKREDAIEQARRNWTGEDDWIASTEINLLKNLPTTDVVEVVRCKDCKHKPTNLDIDSWPIFPDEENNPCPCCCEDGFYSWIPNDDFYCSYGERADA